MFSLPLFLKLQISTIDRDRPLAVQPRCTTYVQQPNNPLRFSRRFPIPLYTTLPHHVFIDFVLE